MADMKIALGPCLGVTGSLTGFLVPKELATGKVRLYSKSWHGVTKNSTFKISTKFFGIVFPYVVTMQKSFRKKKIANSPYNCFYRLCKTIKNRYLSLSLALVLALALAFSTSTSTSTFTWNSNEIKLTFCKCNSKANEIVMSVWGQGGDK